MKKNFKFLVPMLMVLSVLSSFHLANAQSTVNCQTPHTPFSPPNTVQPNTCNNLLNDIAPKTGDRVIEVNVRFWVFAPTATATGIWTQPGHVSTAADAQIALDTVNRYFSKMPYPIPPPPTGVDTVRNPRIKFVLKSFSVVPNPTAYSSAGTIFTNYPAYNPSDAINLYFADCEGGQCACYTFTPDGWPHKSPNNYAVFSPDLSGGATWNNITL